MTTGFTFGAKTTSAPTFGTGSLTFGAPTNQPQLGFGTAAPSLFGQPASTLKPTSGFSLGGTPGSTGFAFGASTGQTGLGFGATATNAVAPTLGFGATATNAVAPTLGFGATATNAVAPTLGFGATATNVVAPTLGFGAPATSAPTLGFGAPVSSTPSLGFGAPITSTPGLSFGTSSTSAPAFGTPATQSTGFGFGAPVSTSGLSFGATPASTGLSFGSTPATTGLSFGTAAPSTGVSFATPAPSTGLTFGNAPTSTGLSFGAPSGLFGTTTSTGLGGFGTTTTPSLGMSFGAVTSASSSGFGFGGALPTTTTPSLALNLTSSQPASTGLGGIATSQTKVTTQQKEIPPKEQLLPNEILQTVEQFKKYVQEQKMCSSEVARCSIKEFRKLETELDTLNQLLSQIETQLLNDRNQVENLKYDTAKGLQHIEMAQRTQDTPPGLQFENTAPIQYFLELAEHFEKEMQLLKTKIDNAEKFVKKYGDNPTLTSQDLSIGLKRLHNIFVALAGRMYSIHSQVETQKEQYLNMRRQLLNDNNNPFEKTNRNEAINTILNYAIKTTNILEGPTPFNNMVLGSNNVVAPQQSTSSTFGIATTQTGNQSNLFKTNTTLPSNSFQLQKPPTGNKRGKQ